MHLKLLKLFEEFLQEDWADNLSTDDKIDKILDHLELTGFMKQYEDLIVERIRNELKYMDESCLSYLYDIYVKIDNNEPFDIDENGNCMNDFRDIVATTFNYFKHKHFNER